MTRQEAIPGLLSHIESPPEREQKSLGLLGAMLSEWWHHVWQPWPEGLKLPDMLWVGDPPKRSF